MAIGGNKVNPQKFDVSQIKFYAYLLPLAALASSVGVIGGADGPTTIFVTGSRGGILFTLLLIAGGICGILAVVKFLQKRRK